MRKRCKSRPACTSVYDINFRLPSATVDVYVTGRQAFPVSSFSLHTRSSECNKLPNRPSYSRKQTVTKRDLSGAPRRPIKESFILSKHWSECRVLKVLCDVLEHPSPSFALSLLLTLLSARATRGAFGCLGLECLSYG